MFRVYNKGDNNKIKTQVLVREEFLSFMLVLLVVLHGYIIFHNFSVCFLTLLCCYDSYLFISRDIFPPEFHKAWKLLLCYHIMFTQCLIKCGELLEWDVLRETVLDAIVHVFSNVKNAHSKVIFSVNFIYIHILQDHFVQQILWLGPSFKQNTQLWEHFHQVLKEYGDNAYAKVLYKNTMQQVTSSFFLPLILLINPPPFFFLAG